jgi:hypothetical protein
MERMKAGWFRIPRRIRRPIVIVVGFLFVIAAGLTGWLPGPGGIPLFLIGVAILATEYSWAERFRDLILDIVKAGGRWLRKHPAIAKILIIWTLLCAALVSYVAYLFYAAL